jgi:hypothetical protein
MKKVFEENDTVPGTSSPVDNTAAKAKTTPKSTVKKSCTSATSSGGDVDDTQITPSTKRKRASPRKKVAPTEDEAKFKPDPENEDDQEELLESKPKRTKAGKNTIKVTPKLKLKRKGIVKKEDINEDGEDFFFDAQEDLTYTDEAGEIDHDSYAVHDRKLPYLVTFQHLNQRTEDPLAEPSDSLEFTHGFI